MSRRALKSVPGQIIPPAPSSQSIPGRKRGLAPLIRATKIRYPELSEAEIAKRVGCSPSNVHQVLSVFLHGHSEQELRDFQANKADIYDSVQMRALASVTQEKLRKSSAGSLVTVAAILEDKARLIRGQATSIHVHALVDVLDAISELREQRDERDAGGLGRPSLPNEPVTTPNECKDTE
jgi:hypothetical protein